MNRSKYSFLAPEVVDSGLTGQYQVGPVSRGQSDLMPLNLALRNIYTYETSQMGTGKAINWGIKKSYISRESDCIALCGIRVSGVGDTSGFLRYKLKFWHSDFTRLVELQDNSYSLQYQFSVVDHDESRFDDSDLTFLEHLYWKWADLIGYHNERKRGYRGMLDNPDSWLSSKHFHEVAPEFYAEIYSQDFEHDILDLVRMAREGAPPPFGLVTLACKLNDDGRIGWPKMGEFRSYLPARVSGTQSYKVLEHPKMRSSSRRVASRDYLPKFYDYRSVFGGATPIGVGRFKISDEFSTSNPGYYAEVNAAIDLLQKHFAAVADRRPANCLIMGAPGSGKTFLAKKIGKAIDGAALVKTYNLSHVGSPQDVDRIFSEIAEDQNKYKSLGRIYFFDEFDVTISGSSSIRYLIDYIYEGEINGQRFGRVAFLFSGGTIESRNTLSLIQENASDFDISQYVYDCGANLHGHGEAFDSASKLLEMIWGLGAMRSQNDRRQGVIRYLLGLDKLPDFLSRINGFVLEIPSIANPLAVTRDRYLLSSGGSCGLPVSDMMPNSDGLTDSSTGSARPGVALKDFVLSLEAGFKSIFKDSGIPNRLRFPYLITGASPIEHVLEYKNMILCERYSRVLYEMGSQHGEALRDEEGAGRVPVLDKMHLNFLCVVPLVHGSRSLAFLVSKVVNITHKSTSVGDSVFGLPREAFHQDTFKMHVVNCEYSDIRSWWVAIFKDASFLSDIPLPVPPKPTSGDN